MAVLATATTLWWTSDARHTTLTIATDPERQVTPAQQVPSSLAEAWRAPSPATPVPVVRGGTVVTAASGEVTGRDLVSGSVRWSYRRDLPLCTVAAALNRVVAVYRRGQTCSEVTTVRWADGRRGPQRTGPVQAPTRLLAEGNLVAAVGQRYLEVWRTDLVRTLAYGRLPTPVQPGRQPRPDCAYGSSALGPGKLAVVERCPKERSPRLTVQRSHPKEADQPEVDFSTLLPGQQAYVVAVSAERVAVAVADPPRLLVLDAEGDAEAEHPLAIPDSDLQADPPGRLAMTTQTPTGVYWFTGSATVALAANSFRPRWSWPGSLGSGSMLADRLLVPTTGGLAVLDIASGQQLRLLPVDRGGYSGPISTAGSGDVVVEQRGDTLVALR